MSYVYTIDIPLDGLHFRPVISYDAAIIAAWRNTPEARAAFFDKRVVTPDTHLQFLDQRKPHDLVWMCYKGGQSCQPFGMTSLTVDVDNAIAEYGRTFISPDHRGLGLAKQIEWGALWAAFDWLRLGMVWLVSYRDNEAVIGLHNKLGWLTTPEDARYHPGADTVEMRYYADAWQRNKERIRP